MFKVLIVNNITYILYIRHCLLFFGISITHILIQCSHLTSLSVPSIFITIHKSIANKSIALTTNKPYIEIKYVHCRSVATVATVGRLTNRKLYIVNFYHSPRSLVTYRQITERGAMSNEYIHVYS